jgi:nucleotide-binding universal stress UspA family protein
MTSETDARPVLRVLVALDTSPGSRAAAEAATQLAALLEAELSGIFIEDMDLLDLSRSPMARQAGLWTAAVHRVGRRELEHQFRVQGERARQSLARYAARAEIPWSFRVLRGAVATEIHGASTETDLVCLGRTGWALRHRRALGRTARRLLAERRRHILLIDRHLDLKRPILLIFDGSEAARNALALALQLQAGSRTPLFVAWQSRGRNDREKMARLLQSHEKTVHLLKSGGELSAARIGHLAHHRGCGLVILPLGGGELAEEQLQDVVERLHCPVLFVS